MECDPGHSVQFEIRVVRNTLPFLNGMRSPGFLVAVPKSITSRVRCAEGAPLPTVPEIRGNDPRDDNAHAIRFFAENSGILDWDEDDYAMRECHVRPVPRGRPLRDDLVLIEPSNPKRRLVGQGLYSNWRFALGGGTLIRCPDGFLSNYPKPLHQILR
jgi:hypothetical protein